MTVGARIKYEYRPGRWTEGVVIDTTGNGWVYAKPDRLGRGGTMWLDGEDATLIGSTVES